MKDLIWKKLGKGGDVDAAVMDFLAGEDVRLDQALLLFDLQASAAHVSGLAGAGVLNEAEAGRLQ